MTAASCLTPKGLRQPYRRATTQQSICIKSVSSIISSTALPQPVGVAQTVAVGSQAPKVAEYSNLGLWGATTSWLLQPLRGCIHHALAGDKLQFVDAAGFIDKLKFATASEPLAIKQICR